MYRFVFYIFLCICTVQAAPRNNRATNATQPLTFAERSKVLREFRDFLKKPTYTLQDIDLFIYKVEEVVPEEVPVVEEVVEAPKVVEPSEHDLLVLRSVGRAIRPEGNLSTNGQYVLCLSGHRLLKVGDVLYARFKGHEYPITLKSVTRNQFTLEINEKELTFQY